jgi:hypothetical protein
MTGPLFETPERGGNLWRLEVVQHKGRTFANWRKWWRDGAGELRPTKQGVTFPPERLSELLAALEAWRDANALSGPENGS